MKIATWNINGIRSAYKKGLKEYIKNFSPDILCLQEIKAEEIYFPNIPNEYFVIVNPAIRKGYWGTSILSKTKPLSINNISGYSRFDQEGRFIQLEFEKFILINVYMPHGGRFFENLEYKIEAYKNLLNLLSMISKPVILLGDFNIAHHEVDLARPKQNATNIMFTRAERDLLNTLEKNNFIDTLRYLNQSPNIYTWWPYAFKARERNIGWRMDIPNLKERVNLFHG